MKTYIFYFQLLISIFCFVATLSSCSKKDKVRTTNVIEEITDEGEIEYLEDSPTSSKLLMKNSILRLNYKLNKDAINNTFNSMIDSLLANDMEVEGMDIILRKKGNATIEFEGKNVLVNFPLSIIASKETFLKTIKAEGIIDLSLVTALDIDDAWNMSSETSLVDYQWVEKPVAKMGMFSLPIESIMNVVIDKSKDRIIDQIDRSIREEVDLRQKMTEVIAGIAKPFLIDEKSGTKLKIVADTFMMTGALNNQEWTTGKIQVTGQSIVSQDESDLTKSETKFPSFSWYEDDKEISDLYINTLFEFKKINDVLNENFVGLSFQENGNEITIKHLEVKGYEDKLGIIADVEGTYNGQIFLSGIPDYNKKKKAFTTRDIEIKLLTKNILHKALAWMLKGRIKSELDKMLQISFGDYLKVIQSMIDERIGAINDADKIIISAQVQDLDLTKFSFTEENINAIVHIPLHLAVSVKNIFNASDFK